MLKVAVCFFGLLRTNKLVASKIKENLLEPLQADLFVCCPSVFFSVSALEPIRAQVEPERVTENYLTGTYNPYIKNYNIINYNPNKFRREVSIKGLPETATTLIAEGTPGEWRWTGWTFRTLSMFYQIKTVLSLIEEAENKLHYKYDAIILMRPDLDIKNKANLSALDLNKVYFTGEHIAPVFGTTAFISDHMLISNRENILKLQYLYDQIPVFHKKNILINNETLLGHYLTGNNLQFEYSDFLNHSIERGDVP